MTAPRIRTVLHASSPVRLARLLALSLTLGGLIVLGVALPATGKAAKHHGGGHLPIYRNPSYSPAERAADLVARMSLAEQASQMVSSQAPAIPRLGIHAYGWWNEAAHGVARMQLSNGATTILNNTVSYPVDLSLGSTWNPNLIYQEATQISAEAREIAPGNTYDLDFFSPTINLSRDPRWGRNDESFSEDPLLTATLASQYVDGLEGKSQSGKLLPQAGGYLKAIATLKHYDANDDETTRLGGSSNMDERTLREYYTASFRQIIEQSQPGGIMAAYNSVNGTPSTANVHLLSTLARETFGFKGYVTSDCDAIDGIVSYHHWSPPGAGRPLNEAEAHAYANAAGTDLNCTVPTDTVTAQGLLPAASVEGIHTQRGNYTANDLETSLVRLFTARMDLGEFGNVASEPWVKAARAQLPAGSWTNSDANHAVTETPARLGLDRQVADQSLVLLKNSVIRRRDGSVGALLPLSVPRSGPFKVAVIGYEANPPYMFLGGYSSTQGAPGQRNEVTPYQGIRQAIQSIDPSAQVDYYSGFTSGANASELTNIDPAAVAAAANYNDVIVYTGTDASVAREGLDRKTLALPGAQAQLIADVAARNPNTIAVMSTVGEVDLDSFAPSVPAMVWSSYNGELQGDALADVLLGKYDPSGHLPFSWYQNDSDLPPITDYAIRPSGATPGRTYMYYRGPVSYPFGYGLSYTSFRGSGLKLSSTRLDANASLTATVQVTNTGPVEGSDLVELYVVSPGAPANSQLPQKRLEGFQQVALNPGQSRSVTLKVKVPDLGFFDTGRGHFVIDDGEYVAQVATSATTVQQQVGFRVGGSLTPVPAALSASPTMPGDAARGIPERVMFPENTPVIPNLTAAMNDQSLYDYVGAGMGRLAHGMKLHFRSDRPSVVSVAGNGAIRTRHNGVATVTATFTYHGVSQSTQFVIRVLSELSQLKVGGSGVAGFYPDVHTYDVIVPDGAGAPRIQASADPSGHLSVSQASGVPGDAVARVTGPDGISTTYTVYFAHPAKSDQFSGRVGHQWHWVGRDPAKETVAHGALVITPERGDLTGNSGSPRNLLVQPALGDWTISSKLSLSGPPATPTQDAGIIAYQDGQNYLQFGLGYSDHGPSLTLTTEDGLSGRPVRQVLKSMPTQGPLASTVWLRMVKQGPRYSAYYSGDGRHYSLLYRVGASLSNVKVGLFAFAGADPLENLTAAFADFRVTNSAGGGALAGGSHRSHHNKKHHGRRRAARATPPT